MELSSARYPAADKGCLVVWGLLASSPYGGMVWQALHHLVGLRRLGFDVWYVEDSDAPVHSPSTWWPTRDYEEVAGFLARHMARIGLGDRWIFRPPAATSDCYGARDRAGLKKLYREADAVINVCGANKLRPDFDAVRRLILLQTDPVAPQIEVAKGNPYVIEEFDAYDFLFSYGENFGSADCLVPLERYEWLPTRAPICVDWWQTQGAPAAGASLTTVGNWRNSGKDIEWKGEVYRWRKVDEFERFISLSDRSPLPLGLALVGHREDETALLIEHGWKVISARELADPDIYRNYIRGSLGEFTVAKDQNIRLRSGWFSDRSACYLAAGRPVVTQDTGFGNILPTGEGLFAFRDQDEALEAIDAIARDYERHSNAARDIAREYFSAERVLGSVLARAGLL